MTKVISLSDDAYTRLYNLKRGKESFSEVVMKVTEKESENSLLKYAGAWKDDAEEMTKIFAQIEKERHEMKTRDYKL